MPRAGGRLRAGFAPGASALSPAGGQRRGAGPGVELGRRAVGGRVLGSGRRRGLALGRSGDAPRPLQKRSVGTSGREDRPQPSQLIDAELGRAQESDGGLRKGLSTSIGSGKTTVEFWLTPISESVWR